MLRATILIGLIAVVTSACTATDETRPLSLAEALEDVSVELNGAVAELFETLDQPYDDRSQLYQRLLDLRLPTRFAILRDKAQRVNPPAGTEVEADRYADFIAELLLASEDLDLAIASEDPAATAIAAVVIEVSIGSLAVALPTTSCGSLTPAVGRDLCDPGGLDGYEASLGFELRRFVASFRPAFRIPNTFGEVIKGRVLATLQADAARVLETTSSRIAVLDPGTAYVRVHEVVLEYFPAAAEAWAEHEAISNSSDAFIYSFIVNSLEEERTATQELLEEQFELVLSALPDSQITSVTDTWFASPPNPDRK